VPHPRRSRFALALVLLAAASCGHRRTATTDGTVEIPAGPFWTGSSLDDRAQALDARRREGPTSPMAVAWLREEAPLRRVEQSAFRIMVRPVTQYDYWTYTQATGAPEPWLDARTWEMQATGYAYGELERFAWTGGHPPPDRLEHPAVLVAQDDAERYCRWWGMQRGVTAELPSELEWEKAARGVDGRQYPWGNDFGLQGAARAHVLESGHADTAVVGTIPESASPYGVLDMAGNVFEWTRTPAGATTYIVKGGAWNSEVLSARAAARHARPASTRHIAIGFRCVVTDDGHPETKPARRRHG